MMKLKKKINFKKGSKPKKEEAINKMRTKFDIKIK
jgi:hypothetical protein